MSVVAASNIHCRFAAPPSAVPRWQADFAATVTARIAAMQERRDRQWPLAGNGAVPHASGSAFATADVRVRTLAQLHAARWNQLIHAGAMNILKMNRSHPDRVAIRALEVACDCFRLARTMEAQRTNGESLYPFRPLGHCYEDLGCAILVGYSPEAATAYARAIATHEEQLHWLETHAWTVPEDRYAEYERYNCLAMVWSKLGTAHSVGKPELAHIYHQEIQIHEWLLDWLGRQSDIRIDTLQHNGLWLVSRALSLAFGVAAKAGEEGMSAVTDRRLREAVLLERLWELVRSAAITDKSRLDRDPLWRAYHDAATAWRNSGELLFQGNNQHAEDCITTAHAYERVIGWLEANPTANLEIGGASEIYENLRAAGSSWRRIAGAPSAALLPALRVLAEDQERAAQYLIQSTHRTDPASLQADRVWRLHTLCLEAQHAAMYGSKHTAAHWSGIAACIRATLAWYAAHAVEGRLAAEYADEWTRKYWFAERATLDL